MTTNRNEDIIYYKREIIVIIPILNIYWQNIFIVRLSHDLCVTHVSQSMEALILHFKLDKFLCPFTLQLLWHLGTMNCGILRPGVASF